MNVLGLTDIDGFPPRDPDLPPRTIYFEGLSAEAAEELTRRGYNPVVLISLPRGDIHAERAYLRAKAQAIEEGTVSIGKQQFETLRLLFKAVGLLDEARGKEEETVVEERQENIHELIDLVGSFDPSRHTIDQSVLSQMDPKRRKK